MSGNAQSVDTSTTESVWLADRLADYVRMYFEANPPMPDAIAVAWRDYQDERGRSPNAEVSEAADKKR